MDSSPELQRFLEQEQQKAMITETVGKITSACWDKCRSRARAGINASMVLLAASSAQKSLLVSLTVRKDTLI